MTDEERRKARQKVLSYLRDPARDFRSDIQSDVAFNWAADEIERLAEERDQFVEQLAILSESGMAKDMQEIMRINNEQTDEIKRLAKDRLITDGALNKCQGELNMAFNEIERLAALAQSDTRLRCLITGNPCGTDTWEQNTPCKCANCQTWLAQSNAEPESYGDQLRRVMKRQASPRPDASAGLIEAAEWHEQQALRFAASPHTSDKMRGMMHKEDARKLRARAADRSEKMTDEEQEDARKLRARAADRSEKMTDEERRKLCDDLLAEISKISWLLTRAAEALVQSDAEPLMEIEEALLWLADEPVEEMEINAHLDKMPMHFIETMRKVRARAVDRSEK